MASAADLSKTLADQGVRYVFGAYTDVHGVPKSKCVPITSLERWPRLRALHRRGAGGHGRTRPQRGRVQRPPRPRRGHRAALGPALRPRAGQPLPRTASPTAHDFRASLQHQVAAAADTGLPVQLRRRARGVRAAPRRRRVGSRWSPRTRQRADPRLRPRDDDARRRLPGADGRVHRPSSAGTSTPSTTRAATGSTSSTSATPTR